MRRSMAFLVGALCGALVGSFLAVLLAPASGEELRRGLSARLMTMRREIRQAYDTRMQQLQNELETLRSPKAM